MSPITQRWLWRVVKIVLVLAIFAGVGWTLHRNVSELDTEMLAWDPAWLIVAGYTSINAVVKAELFPTSVRATGVGLPYAVTVSVFGGTAESIALWFQSIGHQRWFYYYLTAVIATSLIVYVTMRDTKRASAMGRHE